MAASQDQPRWPPLIFNLQWPPLTINLVSKNGGCLSQSTTVAASHDQLTWLIVRGGHCFYLLSWSWEATTVVDRERRPPFLLTKLIVRGGHRKMINFSKIHYTKWHKIWLTLFICNPINQDWWPPLVTTSLGQAVELMKNCSNRIHFNPFWALQQVFDNFAWTNVSVCCVGAGYLDRFQQKLARTDTNRKKIRLSAAVCCCYHILPSIFQ